MYLLLSFIRYREPATLDADSLAWATALDTGSKVAGNGTVFVFSDGCGHSSLKIIALVI
jgi:hypothetical protein